MDGRHPRATWGTEAGLQAGSPCNAPAAHPNRDKASRARVPATCCTPRHAHTLGVESRKDAGVVDEIPGAYKDIAAVIAAQTDLVVVRAELKQVLCVKG
jgi:tRNA-splicing ligase RtcB (3'-phosphate/5'-hydroxy nucleic acid ligase)